MMTTLRRHTPAQHLHNPRAHTRHKIQPQGFHPHTLHARHPFTYDITQLFVASEPFSANLFYLFPFEQGVLEKHINGNRIKRAVLGLTLFSSRTASSPLF